MHVDIVYCSWGLTIKPTPLSQFKEQTKQSRISETPLFYRSALQTMLQGAVQEMREPVTQLFAISHNNDLCAALLHDR